MRGGMPRKASAEIYPGQRNKEKRRLFGRFVLRPIESHYKEKFFALFDSKCFKCKVLKEPVLHGYAANLCIDHHLPMALGGHLVPGNLVVLCRSCNLRKLDQPPEVFYTARELELLQPLLDSQADLFNFSFDSDAWQQAPQAYLLGLGLSEDVVASAHFDEYDHDYIGLPDPPFFRFTIGVKIGS